MATTKRKGRTALGSRRFRCRACRRRCNERTGTPFNDRQYPTDIVLLAVLWRLRYKLGFRDVAELLLQRGFEVSHETIRAWEVRFAPLLADRRRAKRRGHAGSSWYLDETYVKVTGRWCSLYRAIDREGMLLDSMLSAHRDKHAARRFLRRLVDVVERKTASGSVLGAGAKLELAIDLSKYGLAHRKECLGVLDHVLPSSGEAVSIGLAEVDVKLVDEAISALEHFPQVGIGHAELPLLETEVASNSIEFTGRLKAAGSEIVNEQFRDPSARALREQDFSYTPRIHRL